MKNKGRTLNIPTITNSEGKRVFVLNHTIDNAVVRPVPVQTPPPGSASVENQSGDEMQNADGGDDTSSSDGLVRQRWRLISACLAWPGNAYGIPILVDYGYDNAKMIRQIPAVVNSKRPDFMKNHSDDVNNIVGHIENSAWEESKDIANGVNAEVVIDPELEPIEAKKLEKGLYRSGSIGISSEMQKSHPDMDDYEFFFEKMGKKVKGELVCFQPTKLFDVYHMAIVPKGRGADKDAGVRNSTVLHHTENKDAGGTHMKTLLDLVNALCAILHIDPITVENEELPEGFEAKLTGKVESLSKTFKEYSAITSGLQACEKYCLKPEETGLKVSEIVERLPERLEMAKHGEAYLLDLRKEALKWFDAAKVEKDVKELSDADKKRREYIAQSTDIEFIGLQLEEYKAIAEKRFGTDTHRTTENDELPNKNGRPEQPEDRKKAKIAANTKRLFGGKE